LGKIPCRPPIPRRSCSLTVSGGRGPGHVDYDRQLLRRVFEGGAIPVTCVEDCTIVVLVALMTIPTLMALRRDHVLPAHGDLHAPSEGHFEEILFSAKSQTFRKLVWLDARDLNRLCVDTSAASTEKVVWCFSVAEDPFLMPVGTGKPGRRCSSQEEVYRPVCIFGACLEFGVFAHLPVDV
jgi:hypothetical protein